MADYVAGELLARGKTKNVHAVQGDPDVVLLANRTEITANDDPSVTQQLAGKAELATTTTCNVFELLRTAGVPVAYCGRVGETIFAADHCTMLPLELVARRYAVGSYLKRNPHIPKLDPPARFMRLATELFLKTNGGHCKLGDGLDHDLGLDPSQGQEDPLLARDESGWQLFHPKQPPWQGGAVLGQIGEELLPYDFDAIDAILRQAFLVLEGAWASLGWRLIDLKIELGTTAEGQLVVADVIDADSWRLRDQRWQEMSKQVFRDQLAADAVDLDDVAWRYRQVAELTGRFRIPEQAIVVWLGSKSDEDKLKWETDMPAGVEAIKMVLSGHRETLAALQALPALEAIYPGGGVILACVGLSNGLGPIVSTHTHWPVVNVPLTIEDVPSSLRLPNRVPATTALRIGNAVQQAWQILGISNPAAYAAARVLAEADPGLSVPLITDITKSVQNLAPPAP